MKSTFRKLALYLFNRVFATSVTRSEVETIRLVTSQGIRIQEADVEAVKLVTKEHLHIRETDVAIIRYMLKGMGEDSVALARALCGEGGVFTAKLDAKLLQQLETVAILNRLDDIGDISEGTQLSYAQEGEAFILDRFFNYKTEGYFVDVGALHPKRFSNTYSFYRRGWRGINIEPTPGVKEMFDAIRPEDISLSVAVSDVEGKQDFYMFTEPALNTFSKSLADEYLQVGCKLLEILPIETKGLARLLEDCKVDRPIDFMSIDVEDHELPVLLSNDWERFRPHVLLVEILNFDLSTPEVFPVHCFILDKGYVMFAKTINTLFYRDGR